MVMQPVSEKVVKLAEKEAILVTMISRSISHDVFKRSPCVGVVKARDLLVKD